MGKKRKPNKERKKNIVFFQLLKFLPISIENTLQFPTFIDILRPSPLYLE